MLKREGTKVTDYISRGTYGQVYIVYLTDKTKFPKVDMATLKVASMRDSYRIISYRIEKRIGRKIVY